MEKRILVVNGPNLNLLGKRPKELYGTADLPLIEAKLTELAGQSGVVLEFFQSNHEGALIDRLHQAMGECDGIIINPGAYTHTSLALKDALESVAIPTVEVHLSDIMAREPARRESVLAGVVAGRICGLGWPGYLLALRYLVDYLHLPR